MIKDSGDRTEFGTGAVRDMSTGKGRMDLLPWFGIMEVSKHCEDGALKYGEHNVDLGIPEASLMDSAARHIAKYIAGMTDEDHLRAAAWNILWALNQRTTHPELMTMHDWMKGQTEQEKDTCDGCRLFENLPCAICKRSAETEEEYNSLADHYYENEVEEHDGCVGCMFEPLAEELYPCSRCKQSTADLQEKETRADYYKRGEK